VHIFLSAHPDLIDTEAPILARVKVVLQVALAVDGLLPGRDPGPENVDLRGPDF
jgi:hypothetical protein